jgi:murein DD-endopeptidase MepM/ murein hydrolase activator NlpD
MKTSLPSGPRASPLRGLRRAAALLALGLLAACGGAPRHAHPPATSQPVTVVVVRGDTLLGIARQNGVTLNAIASANGLAPPYRIHPGQVLHIPGTLPPPVPIATASAPPIGPASASAIGAPIQVASTAPLVPPPVEETAPSAPIRSVTAEALPPPGGARAAEEPQAGQPAQYAALPLPPPPPPTAQRAEEAPRDPAVRASPAPPYRRMPPGRFAWPVRGQVVSAFGSKGGGMVNDGMNIAAPRGTPVRAASDGTVIYAGNEVRGFGNLVLIRHEGGWVTAYGHAERVIVRQGQAVRTGEEIARVGSSGAVSTPQLHFQVRREGKPVDPAAHLERAVANRSS